MEHTTMKATVKGTTCEGAPFTETLEFAMIPPDDNNHYGTGYYMSVVATNESFPPRKEYCDVRYERTTDIEVLADRYIENYYGKNAQEVIKQF